ncbi:hypothetical protein A8709_29495 [Paenibacillus pectinilyticus]|uniref:SLH domain-containing protein n=1 Tax=Paenibacillus pectinilyticus TaxID=512399 RepID=A0A1C0ZV64_9BACL|nr:S-layer homology domain-containing protein [Paenibacillus pectinilyticus]OCT11994.1 hypothetical protein A8709_29495 [Paenibacillus pectinilyticus]
MKKKIFALVSSLTFVTLTGCNATETFATSSPSSVQSIQFKDITDHWAKSSVETAIKKGYIDGYEDHTFKPDSNVSRAEFIKMAVTALNLPVQGDTTGSTWYVPFATAAATLGIYKGSDFSLDDMNQPMTRLEMARVALRSANKDYQDSKAITNDPSIMYNAAKLGLIQGLSGGQLGEDEATTRAQSVTIIERILSVKSGGKLEVDQAAVNNAELVLKHTNIFSKMPEFFGGVQYGGANWDTSKLTVETPDGLWKGSIDQIIAIDLEDPSDPNLYMLGDFNKLHWFDLMAYESSPLIKDGFMKSYVLYFKGHVDYNRDESIYSTQAKMPRYSLTGFEGTSQDLVAHYLNQAATIYTEKVGDVPAFIIPKNAKLGVALSLSLSSPARPPYDSNPQTVVRVQTKLK